MMSWNEYPVQLQIYAVEFEHIQTHIEIDRQMAYELKFQFG